MTWQLLAAGVALVHGAFLAYVAVGGLVALRWPRTAVLHAAAVGWGVLVVAASIRCPLTWLEDRLRQLGGKTPLPGGFIDRYVEGVLYPARLTVLVQVLVAALVVACWLSLLAGRSSAVGRRQDPVEERVGARGEGVRGGVHGVVRAAGNDQELAPR